MSGDSNAITYIFLFALVVLGLRSMWRTTFPSDGKIKAEARRRVTIWLGHLFK